MNLRYPIGKWEAPSLISTEKIKEWIYDIRNLPDQLDQLCQPLNELHLGLLYREEGWSIRQIIHHIADSHMNAYIRHKLAITTDEPTINPYPEQLWSELEDVKQVDVRVSLQLISALHNRWFVFLKSLANIDYEKRFYHPGSQRFIEMKESIGMYSWHGRHHLEHIKIALSK